jgi:hypothetical protein
MAPMVVVVVTPLTSKNHTSLLHPSHPYTDATMSEHDAVLKWKQNEP